VLGSEIVKKSQEIFTCVSFNQNRVERIGLEALLLYELYEDQAGGDRDEAGLNLHV
jgi:hypothetical protein